MTTSSSTTTPFGGVRIPTRAIVIAVAAALVAGFVAAVIAVVGLPGFGFSREAAAPSANSMPTPAWLTHYLEKDAPTATSVPRPEWLEHYLELDVPGTGSPADPTPRQRVNAGLR